MKKLVTKRLNAVSQAFTLGGFVTKKYYPNSDLIGSLKCSLRERTIKG